MLVCAQMTFLMKWGNQNLDANPYSLIFHGLNTHSYGLLLHSAFWLCGSALAISSVMGKGVEEGEA